MKLEKKVSIIVPVYNTEKYLNRCVESIIKQTYTNIEMILVDDGSPDHCPMLCDQLALKYKNIKVIHKNNGGLSSARKEGFFLAQGEYILFIDSDDYIDSYMVEKLVISIESVDAEVSMCGYYTVRKNGERQTYYLPYEKDKISGSVEIKNKYLLPLIGENSDESRIPGFLCIRLFKRNLIEEAYFVSEREYFLEDHIFNLLYLDKIRTIAIVNEPLYYYCINKESLSNCYRKSKWKMYLNLLHFYLEYLKERKIKNCDKRINCFVINAVFNSIDNAVLSGSYQEFLKELYVMINDSTVFPQFFKNSTRDFSFMRKVVFFLLKFKMYYFIYFLRKFRLNI